MDQAGNGGELAIFKQWLGKVLLKTWHLRTSGQGRSPQMTPSDGGIGRKALPPYATAERITTRP